MDRDQRTVALAEFVAAYEAEQGEITAEEMREATRQARARAVVIRGAKCRRQPRR